MPFSGIYRYLLRIATMSIRQKCRRKVKISLLIVYLITDLLWKWLESFFFHFTVKIVLNYWLSQRYTHAIKYNVDKNLNNLMDPNIHVAIPRNISTVIHKEVLTLLLRRHVFHNLYNYTKHKVIVDERECFSKNVNSYFIIAILVGYQYILLPF